MLPTTKPRLPFQAELYTTKMNKHPQWSCAGAFLLVLLEFFSVRGNGLARSFFAENFSSLAFSRYTHTRWTLSLFVPRWIGSSNALLHYILLAFFMTTIIPLDPGLRLHGRWFWNLLERDAIAYGHGNLRRFSATPLYGATWKDDLLFVAAAFVGSVPKSPLALAEEWPS